MVDEMKIEDEELVSADALETDVSEPSIEPAPKKKNKKKKIGILAGVLAVVVVAGIGFWVWHETPGFCANAICHDSMDPYLTSFNQEDNTTGIDKWGFEVSNTHAMLVVAHQGGGIECLDCHEPDIRQQVGEAMIQLTGRYEMPLHEVGALELMENSYHVSPSGTGDEFCINDACHANLTRESLTMLTSKLEFNPHSWHHTNNQCTDCHKSHRASVLTCTQCHDGSDPNRPDATVILPDGWVDYKTSAAMWKEASA